MADRNRQPAGTPHGGEFARKQHGDAEVGLGEQPLTEKEVKQKIRNAEKRLATAEKKIRSEREKAQDIQWEIRQLENTVLRSQKKTHIDNLNAAKTKLLDKISEISNYQISQARNPVEQMGELENLASAIREMARETDEYSITAARAGIYGDDRAGEELADWDRELIHSGYQRSVDAEQASMRIVKSSEEAQRILTYGFGDGAGYSCSSCDRPMTSYNDETYYCSC